MTDDDGVRDHAVGDSVFKYTSNHYDNDDDDAEEM